MFALILRRDSCLLGRMERTYMQHEDSRRVAEKMGCVELLIGIVNPEQISKYTGCVYYTRAEGWQLPSNCLVVCDEWHRYATGNDIGHGKKMPVIANALMRLYGVPESRLLVLSATLSDTPLKFQVLGRWMGWHSGQTEAFIDWCMRHGSNLSASWRPMGCLW